MNPPMTVLRRGDKVLVALSDLAQDDEARDVAKGLRDAFPGVEFVIVSDVTSISLYSPDNVDPS